MKQVNITIKEAKGLYNKCPELRNTLLKDFSDNDLNISKLKEWKNCFDPAFQYYFISTYSGIGTIESVDPPNNKGLNLVPTMKHAKSILAFSQLSILKNGLDDCEVDWNALGLKYTISRKCSKIKLGENWSTYHFLAFKTEEIRDLFYKQHEDLIKDYFML